jgi:hypothetical protein
MTDRDETRGRFLAAIADQLNPQTVEEAHLFQPIKQGGMESGVAVLAARETAETPENRLAVYTAKYRLTLKGPERGKWDFAINAEADAPLVTVDKVVRGVQRRSGDAEDARKLSGDEFRALLSPHVPPSVRSESA